MTAEVVEAYEAYIEARKEARRLAREQVAAGLRPHLVAIGKAVQAAQNDGLTISEIARVLDIKNRNFIYDAKRAYSAETGEEYKVREYVRSPKMQEQNDTTTEAPYTIEKIGDECFEVTAFGEDYFITTDEDGHYLFPEEWADLGTTDRQTVKAIIAEIRERG